MMVQGRSVWVVWFYKSIRLIDAIRWYPWLPETDPEMLGEVR